MPPRRKKLGYPGKPPSTVELERRFLVDPDLLPELIPKAVGSSILEIGFIGANPKDRLWSRIGRASGGPFVQEYCFTQVMLANPKTKTRIETDTILTKKEFEDCWGLTERCRIRLTRYEMEGATRECQVVLDSLLDAPLDAPLIAEAQFIEQREARMFPRPSWFGPEITGVRRWQTYGLASEPLCAEEICLARRAISRGLANFAVNS